MKSKNLFILATALLALGLASCKQKENHTPGAAESQSETTTITSEESSESTSSETDSSTNLTKLDGLVVFTYGRYMDDANVNSIKNAFNAYAASQGYEVINQVWAGDASSKVADFDKAISAYEANTSNPKIDIILGAKGNLGSGTYVGDNFDVLLKVDGSFVTMTTYLGEEAQADRRIYLDKDLAHVDAVKMLVKSAAGYDIPEEGEEPGTSEESTESETTSETESTGTVSVTLPEIVVYCYAKYVTEEQKAELKTTFDNYVKEKQCAITVDTWVVATTGDMETLQGDIATYNTGHAGHEVDIILGGRAAFTTEYLTANYVYAGSDDADGRMTIGSSSNRRVAYYKNSTHGEAITLLINCFLSNLNFEFAAA